MLLTIILAAVCLIEIIALTCLFVSYKKSRTELNDMSVRLSAINSAYKNFIEHIRVIRTDAPVKRTAQYSAMKLSAYLDKLIRYNDNTGECILVVMDIDIK